MKKIKSTLTPILSGILILAFMVVFMKFISINFRIVLILSCGLFFLAGFISGKNKLNLALVLILISIPYTLVFDILIYKQIPGLLWFTPFFVFSVLSGQLIRKGATIRNAIPSVVLLPMIIIMSLYLVPKLLENELAEVKNASVGSFTIYNMEENPTTSLELKGKIVVLDFFGTWCKPCRLELMELEKIFEHYNGSNDIEFFVINTNEGGDTKEKMNLFIDTHNYPFKFGFDFNRELGDQFDLHGVPYLYIFDKEGKLRYEHVGYNKGESNFVSGITEIIDSLR